MERKLADDQVNQLCMYMRIIDLMQKHLSRLDTNLELKKQYKKLCKYVDEILETISDEEKDEIMEMHEFQLNELKKH